MIIEGEFQVNASVQRTWDLLMDIKELASWVPSCKKVEVFDDKSFAIMIIEKVGPISVAFKTKTVLIDVNPPNRLVAIGKGKDEKMGSSFELTNQMELVQISEKETLVKYKVDAKISGRLASVGQSLIKIIAKKEVDKVVKLIQIKAAGG